MTVLGIDEVGRGCWAGPLVAGAVLLHKPVEGLADSKKLSAKQREGLAKVIYNNASVGLGWVSAIEVDNLGLSKAVALAMQRAYKAVQSAADQVIIDGSINYLPEIDNSRAVIKADASVPAVSAASIVAKVARDEYMREVARELPQYGFDRHVGYGTKAHSAALQTFGVTKHHRKSYKPIKALLQ